MWVFIIINLRQTLLSVTNRKRVHDCGEEVHCVEYGDVMMIVMVAVVKHCDDDMMSPHYLMRENSDVAQQCGDLGMLSQMKMQLKIKHKLITIYY